ncbi:hypothetical protein PHMEG_00016662 [Phytophthora megakarya]|uniref:Uncharacterized protein n=1 Tax=Phytophthora megakarya TaxID=4795 RepID=A0A225VYG8_9STRA|nr:hypothetical protein PHMEG_00016662 [Phytophthora megakarya]
MAGVIPHDVLDLMETDVEEHLEYTPWCSIGIVALIFQNLDVEFLEKALPIMDRQSRNRLQETYTDT